MLLISDRQSTKYNGTKEEWNKIYLLDKLNTVVGFSGSSEGSRMIAETLRANPSDQSFVEQYCAAYRNVCTRSLTAQEREIQALCIVKRIDSIESYRFTRDLYEFAVSRRPIGIGSGEHIIRPQLARDTDSVNLETAIDFGKTLVEYASRVDSAVGPPSQFGFCLATVPLNEKVQVGTLAPQQVSLDKILYSFT